MNWKEYSNLKADGNVSFSKEKVTTREAVEEVQDSDGKVVQAAQAKEEREYVVLVQKSWNGATGEANADSKREYSLSDLEREKARYDNEIARAKEQSDELAKAIADFKKV
jgi:hypothetical protein|tara:strand:- start:136 stop:465 length:330 start_codon:yes stop_codon:yes gene_type:complete